LFREVQKTLILTGGVLSADDTVVEKRYSDVLLWFRLKEIKTAVRGIPRTTAREKMRIAQKLKTP